MDDMHINVGGMVFRVKKSTLLKYPETLLGSLSSSSEFYNEAEDCFYFDRNPDLFNTILDYYRNGVIHLPTHICCSLWKSELQFWKISILNISDCCYPFLANYEGGEKLKEEIQAFCSGIKPPPPLNVSSVGMIRHRLWKFLDDPTSSLYARVFSVLYLTVAIVSATLPCLETHPNIREENISLTKLNAFLNYNDIRTWLNLGNPKEVMYATTTTPQWLEFLNMITMIFFSLEIFLRFISCPSKLNHLREWLTIVDIVLFVGMWAHYGLHNLERMTMLSNVRLVYAYFFTETLTVFRLLRFFRISKQFNSLKILFLALKSSFKELVLLIIIFLVVGWVFANLMYYAEIRESETFPNMLVGWWWAVVTMTTIGYGDTYPTGTVGRIVGSVCALCGLIVLAMPIAVVAGNFSDLHNKNNERETLSKLKHDKIPTVKEQNKVKPIQATNIPKQ